VATDHKPNAFLNEQPVLTGRRVALSQVLQELNLQWAYKGSQKMADALSRHPVFYQDCLTAINHRKSVPLQNHPNFVQMVKARYANDPWFRVEANLVEADLTLDNDMWYKGKALDIPDDELVRQQVLYEVYDTPYAGHPGRDKITGLPRQWHMVIRAHGL
jgi:hypothetical protein